ncbi:hypothetical protein BDV40DRAFT_287038 [Aspergillus tamarii]|uniref:Uncharacterized protein n=1 Tax=Aspergillus tamarii TaxID=41984 RepID=A0A5N6V049_ASPTM|nr:hypothetical protein BDV40DRAFT_287038 [Aspergillus tamarii]
MALLRDPYLQMPGFNLALNVSSTTMTWYGRDSFPTALVASHFDSCTLEFVTVHRDIVVMRVMNSITDKWEWDQKVFNENITSKWYQEITHSGLDMTPKMMAWVIKELQWKAGILSETGYVRIFDVGVLKSDTAISKSLQQALKEQIRPLDNISENQKDYHPRSDQSEHGTGELLPVPPDEEYMFIRSCQWLPCDVELTESGCRIASYINNLHPIITTTIPLWEKSLASRHSDEDGIKYTKVEYGEHIQPEPIPPWGGAEEDAYYELTEAWEASRSIILPEPGELQNIVKLANIELTPENPKYEGGSWHIEGQLNERIAASTIYYYDSENITRSTLSFCRHGRSDFRDVWYQQRHEFLQTIYGFGNDTSGYSKTNVTQELGSVTVSSFSLADRSKPGHRKILPLFLVDPHRRIISSVNRDMKPLMTMDEAREARLELMAERSLQSVEGNRNYETGEFNLCEH